MPEGKNKFVYKGAEIYLFGSRNVDVAKGGDIGDIDLLIISKKLGYDDIEGHL